jgi:hypothetical protein
VHWKVQVMLGMELEVWARRCYLARDRRSAGIPRKSPDLVGAIGGVVLPVATELRFRY